MDAAELVLNISLNNILSSTTVASLMVDGTKRPWLHHKEVAPVLLRLVYKGEVVIHFLGLHVLVKEGRRANVDGYMGVPINPELHRICVACATDCTNMIFSMEGLFSDYLCPKKKHKGGSARPPSQSTHKGTGGFQQ